jgi:hypothetical protein
MSRYQGATSAQQITQTLNKVPSQKILLAEVRLVPSLSLSKTIWGFHKIMLRIWNVELGMTGPRENGWPGSQGGSIVGA